jgi:MFS family permease
VGQSNRALWLILGAQALSTIGTSISTVALAVMVFDLTGSVLHMGGVLAASTLPVVVVSFVWGALLDRYDGRLLMVSADVCRAVLILSMPFAAVRSVVFVYVVAGLVGVFTAVFNPTQVKVVGDLVPRGRLIRANSYLSIARDGAELGGYLVGGVLVATLGYVVTFMIDAASYGVSALLLLALPRVAASAPSDTSLGALVRESPRVLGSLWGSPSLRTNLLFALLPMTAILMTLPNAYGLALDVYKVGPQGFATMEIITSVGWIVGGVVASRLAFKGDRNTYVFLSIVFMGLCFITVSFTRSFYLAVVFLALAACANVGVIVGSMTLYQEIEPRPDKGRLIAIRTGLGQLGAAAGLLSGGALGEILGITPLFAAAGGLALFLGTVVYLPYKLRMVRTKLSLESE